MTRAEASQLNIPTIPGDFITQMVAHLNTSNLSEGVQKGIMRLCQESKVSIVEYTKLFHRLVGELGDEMLGFFPLKVPVGSYAVLCKMLQHSPDLSDAVNHFNRFYSLFLAGNGPLLDMSELKTQQRIVLNPPSGVQYTPMFQHTMLLALLKLMAWLAGQKIPVHALQFNFTAMPFDKEFSYLFGVVPSYGTDNTAIQFVRSALDYSVQPLQSAEEFGERYLEHFLYWDHPGDLVRQVYAEIAHRLPATGFDVVSIARAMHISKHTLARRLKAEGTSYSRVLSRVRRDKAIYLLLSTRASVENVAERVGFVELGSFSRAFKAWTSLTPSEYREQHKEPATIG